jgi:hypothetical protein
MKLQDFAREYFSGWLQSRPNEKLNRYLSDSMNRAAPSKVIACCLCWLLSYCNCIVRVRVYTQFQCTHIHKDCPTRSCLDGTSRYGT